MSCLALPVLPALPDAQGVFDLRYDEAANDTSFYGVKLHSPSHYELFSSIEMRPAAKLTVA